MSETSWNGGFEKLQMLKSKLSFGMNNKFPVLLFFPHLFKSCLIKQS